MAKSPSPQRQARQILAGQYAPVDFAQRRNEARSRKEQAALQAAQLAVVEQLQAGVKPAGATYDAAVGQQQDLARTAAGLLSAANPDARIQSDLASIGAPAEQQAQLHAANQRYFPGAGAVLNVQQGSIPGASLLSQKAAQQGYLAGLPTVAALQGQRAGESLLARAADTRDQYIADRLRIAGQLPGLTMQIQQAERAAAQQAQQFAAEQAYRQAELQAGQTSQASLDTYRRGELRLRSRTSASQSTGLTPYQAAELNQSQQRIDLSRRKTTSPAQRYKPPSPKDLQEQADLAYYGRQPVTNTRGEETTPGLKAVDYQTALFGMLNSGVKLPVAQRYLNQFYAPGERGRPVQSFQQRQAAKRGKKR